MAGKPDRASATTLQDVSKHAGVSAATVSRVLSGSASVGAETTDRVRQAVTALNYTPLRRKKKDQTLASPRKTKRSTGNIGVLLLNNDVMAKYSNDFAATLRSVGKALSACHRSMILADLTAGDPLPEEILRGEVDGLLVAGGGGDDPRLADLPDCPIVWLTSRRDPASGTAALAGNEHVGQIAADYLLEHGCRHLACLDIAADSPANEVRRRFFAFTANQAGAEVRQITGLSELPDNSDADAWKCVEAAVQRMVDELLDSPKPVDGAFVTNPLILGTTYAALRRRGVEPERDLRLVTSGHHEPLLAALSPRPASIDLRGEVIGRCAVHHLLSQIEHPDDHMPVDLMVRARLMIP